MNNPDDKKNKIIKSTDIDALICQNSANSKGYFRPYNSFIQLFMDAYTKYLQYFNGYTRLSANRAIRSMNSSIKLPIINKGTYLRTRSIDVVVENFVKSFDHCQIISIGCGTDTRCLRVLEKFNNVKYVEFDFPDMARLKKVAMLENTEASTVIKQHVQDFEIHDRKSLESIDPNLDSSNYYIRGVDLRHIYTEDVDLSFIEKSEPTLILSECVLCYMTKEQNRDILKFWCDFIGEKGSISFLIYEPMSLSDSFGSVMNENLSRQGINLLNFFSLPDLKTRSDFLASECNLKNVRIISMDRMNDTSAIPANSTWISQEEVKRINALEIVDEIEELTLLLQHYCLEYAEFGQPQISNRVHTLNWNP